MRVGQKEGKASVTRTREYAARYPSGGGLRATAAPEPQGQPGPTYLTSRTLKGPGGTTEPANRTPGASHGRKSGRRGTGNEAAEVHNQAPPVRDNWWRKQATHTRTVEWRGKRGGGAWRRERGPCPGLITPTTRPAQAPMARPSATSPTRPTAGLQLHGAARWPPPRPPD